MEKQRSKSGSKSFGRLLAVILGGIVWLAAGSPGVYAQTLTSAMIQAIRLSPVENQDLYVNSDIKFEAQIPYTLPGQIDVSMPDEIANASFKTLRKVESEGGTKIEIWYSFSREGTYIIPALTLKIKNSRRRISFDPVTVVLNPKDLRPSCVIVTDRGQNVPLTVYTGQTIHFKVCLRHATQLFQFSWDIPKDSLFEQTKVYEFTQLTQREKVVSNELIPVSDFEWTPLVSGQMTFPQFKITAISYSGNREEVIVPPIMVTVLKARGTKNDDGNTLFNDAFDASYVEPDYIGTEAFTADDAVYLAQLRTKEKHSFLFLHKNRKLRAQTEKERGLPYSQKEFALMWIYLAAVLVCGVIILFIIFVKRRNNAASVGLGIVLICSLSLFIYTLVLGTKKYGITTGSQVYSIPESNAGVKSELPCGNRVQIISQSGDWYFIRFGETEGWCLKDGIILI